MIDLKFKIGPVLGFRFARWDLSAFYGVQPCVDYTLDLNLLGVRLYWVTSDLVRRWAFTLGNRWLMRVSFGVLLGPLTPPQGVINYPHHYASLGLLGFSIDLGRNAPDPWRLRVFFNGRRLFYRRLSGAV